MISGENIVDFVHTTLVVENIGGIHHIEADIVPGLNIIEQPNASGKTSFLRAFILLLTPSGINTGMGYMLRSRSTEGFVSVTDVKGNRIKKTITRDKNTITISGDDFVTPEISDIVKRFAIGGSDNEILSAVRSGKNLKDLIVIDNNLIDKLKSEIATGERDLTKLSEELKVIQEAPREKLAAETRKEAVLREIAELEKELSLLQKQHDIIAMSDIENNNTAKEQLKIWSAELQQTESRISESKKNITVRRDRMKKLSDEIELLRRNIDQLENVDHFEVDRINNEMKKIDDQIHSYFSEISTLDMTIQAVRNMVRQFEENPPNATILDCLSDDFHVSCPICGHESGLRTIKQHIDSISLKRGQLQSDMKRLESDKHDFEKEKSELDKKRSEISSAISALRSKERAISQENHSIATIIEAIDELTVSKERLNSKIGQLSKSINDQFVSITMDLARKNESIGKKKSALSILNEDILSYEQEIREIDIKSLSIADLKTNIADLRSQLHRAEFRIQEDFNRVIQEVYHILGFGSNVSRVFLDQNYDLLVSRSTDKDVIYHDMDSVKTLSKSELEVIGITVMISGYMVNELRNHFPYILLDELTFMDNKRLKRLMDYMEKIAPSIILTKLPPESDLTGQGQIRIQV